MKGKPQAELKVLHYLRELIDSGSFQAEIRKIRKKLGIPATGYPMSKDDEEALRERGFGALRTPSTIDKKIAREARIALREVVDAFPISSVFISHGFFLYLIHNKFFLQVFDEGLFLNSICKLVDMRDKLVWTEGVPEVFREQMENLADTHPIAIFIRPEASQRDMTEYIREMRPYIEAYKQRYADEDSKVGKIRKKNTRVQKRNALIYENRNLSSKEIMQLVHDEFNEVLDYTYISKIIASRKRKEKK